MKFSHHSTTKGQLISQVKKNVLKSYGTQNSVELEDVPENAKYNDISEFPVMLNNPQDLKQVKGSVKIHPNLCSHGICDSIIA